jgi:hypothetical protein
MYHLHILALLQIYFRLITEKSLARPGDKAKESGVIENNP